MIGLGSYEILTLSSIQSMTTRKPKNILAHLCSLGPTKLLQSLRLASQASPMHDRLPGDSVALDSGDHVPMEPKALPKKRGRPPKAESKPKAKPTPKAKCKGKIAKPKACSSKSKAKAAAKPKARESYCF